MLDFGSPSDPFALFHEHWKGLIWALGRLAWRFCHTLHPVSLRCQSQPTWGNPGKIKQSITMQHISAYIFVKVRSENMSRKWVTYWDHPCKCGDSGMSLWVKQDVFWLQVSINDVAFVQSFHHQKNWPYVEPWMHHWKEGLADSLWFIHVGIYVFVQSHWWTLRLGLGLAHRLFSRKSVGNWAHCIIQPRPCTSNWQDGSGWSTVLETLTLKGIESLARPLRHTLPRHKHSEPFPWTSPAIKKKNSHRWSWRSMQKPTCLRHHIYIYYIMCIYI